MVSVAQSGVFLTKHLGLRLVCVLAFSQALVANAQPVQAKGAGPVPAAAQVVPMPAQIGPLVATLLPSPWSAALNSGVMKANLSTPLSAVALALGAGASAGPGAGPVSESSSAVSSSSESAPRSLQIEALPEVLQSTAPGAQVQSYLVAPVSVQDAGRALAASPASPPVPASQAQSPVRSGTSKIQVVDGRAMRSVVIAATERVDDGRLSITVVFN